MLSTSSSEGTTARIKSRVHYRLVRHNCHKEVILHLFLPTISCGVYFNECSKDVEYSFSPKKYPNDLVIYSRCSHGGFRSCAGNTCRCECRFCRVGSVFPSS